MTANANLDALGKLVLRLSVGVLMLMHGIHKVGAGVDARGERAAEGRREPPSPPGERPGDLREIRRGDPYGRQPSREDDRLDGAARTARPLLDQGPADLLGPEEREAAPELAGRGADRLAVPSSRNAPEEPRESLEAAERDPHVVDEVLVPAGARAGDEGAEARAVDGEGLLQEPQERAGPERCHVGPRRRS